MPFKVTDINGSAGTGILELDGKKLETPYMFPVMSFYCDGNWPAKFGGGVYRNLKEEFLTSSRFSHLFYGVMTSLSQVSDFQLSKKKLEKVYFKKTIPEWFDFKGFLFVDSGGFKLLTNGSIKGRDFAIGSRRKTILRYQLAFGADILVSLDYPISPSLSPKEKQRRVDFSIRNALWLLSNKPKSKISYVAVHGHDEKDLHTYLSRLLNRAEEAELRSRLDGIAIGSLVPIRNDPSKLIAIVIACKKIMNDFDLAELPIHVFGISSTMLPVLALLGVDTFDSASYIHSAIHGRFYDEKLIQRPVLEATDWYQSCDCEICKNKEYRERVTNDKLMARDRVSPLAIHNLSRHHMVLTDLRTQIRDGNSNLGRRISNRFLRKSGLRRILTHHYNEI